MEYISVGSTSQDGIHPGVPLFVPTPGQHDVVAHTPPATLANGGADQVPPPSGSFDIDVETNDAPLKFRTLDSVLRQAPLINLANGHLTDVLLASIDGEPSLAEEEIKDQRWKAAILEELESIRENKTWSMVELPRGHHPICLKWVFKLKHDEHGEAIKHKARLVAKGYVQRQGIDFEEVFAPVARMESVQVILCFASHFNWVVDHMDVKSAFLNGGLIEEVYVSQPLGLIKQGQEGKVLKLYKAMYGLRQAPRAWNSRLDSELHSPGVEKCKSEHGLYTRVNE
jgi:hypothetical protein